MKSLAINPEKELEVEGCCCAPMAVCDHKREPYYPSVYIENLDQMPEIADMEVGAEVTITFTVKLRSMNIRQTIKGKEGSGDLQLIAYEIPKGK